MVAKMLPLLTCFFMAANALVKPNEPKVTSEPVSFLSTGNTPGKMHRSTGSESVENLEMTSKDMEAAITNLMLGKSAFGATPMGDSVKKITNIVKKTMMPKVLTAHRLDQRNLNSAAYEITKCGSVKDKALAKSKAPFRAYTRIWSKNHKKCRSDEAVRLSSKNVCLIQQRAKYSVKTLKCKYFGSLSKTYGTQKANVAIVKKAGSEKVEQYLTRISGTFCGRHVHGTKGNRAAKGGWGGGLAGSMLDKYLRAKDACNKAKIDYNNKVKECERKTRDYNVRKAKCNQYQRQMDSDSCKAAVIVKDSCEAYAGCYYSKRRAYRIQEKRARAEETDRKAEWRGLERMHCLMKAFADGKVKNSEINTCKRKTVNTKLLTLKYPRIPALKKCAIPTLYPATGAYKRREFKPLPVMAKGLESQPCAGIDTVPTTPRPGSPRGAKCSRLALTGPYSAGGLVKCTNGFDVRRSKDKNSCPLGTKIWSPRSRSDWRTFLASAGPLRAPHWIIDVTRPARRCGGCRSNPMNSGNSRQKTWVTSDGSPWWLRSTRYNEPNGDYSANCFLDLWHGKPRNENHVSFNDGNCNYHSKSYYCQPIALRLTPKSGSPKSCQCSKVDLSGQYKAGSLVKCEQCLTVYRSTQKNSCPNGMKIFSPQSRSDWKTFLASARPLRAPHWIIDVTRPSNGCGGCTRNSMKSTTPQQATWRTSDGSPWWLRSTRYNEPNGDYTANCYLDLWRSPHASENNIQFNDGRCNYRSRSYYCQPSVKPKAAARRRRAPVKKAACFNEEAFYFGQGRKVPNFNARTANMRRKRNQVYYRNTGGTWSGFSRGNNFAARWTSKMKVKTGGNYRFHLASDDGSRVYVDNALVVNNDGLHGWRGRSGSRRLNAGSHSLRIEFFERGGHAGIDFKFKGADTGNVWSRGSSYGPLTCPKQKACPADFPYSSHGGKICYSQKSYAVRGAGPCESWCTVDSSYGNQWCGGGKTCKAFSYHRRPKNTICTGPTYAAITTATECATAARQVGSRYQGTTNGATAPGGCYDWGKNQHAWFNRNAGRASGSVHPICKAPTTTGGMCGLKATGGCVEHANKLFKFVAGAGSVQDCSHACLKNFQCKEFFVDGKGVCILSKGGCTTSGDKRYKQYTCGRCLLKAKGGCVENKSKLIKTVAGAGSVQDCSDACLKNSDCKEFFVDGKGKCILSKGGCTTSGDARYTHYTCDSGAPKGKKGGKAR